MKFDISTDIIPIGEFKAKMTKWLNTVKDKGHPLVITQNGKPAAVVLSPQEFDNLNYSSKFISSVNQGIQDIESGNVYNSKDLRAELLKNRK
ncbi:MAG TPA: type II toxin-antitoxin system Phd/YefM family antitoxin [Ignavibacteriaceae bacterium]|nr:type II toxin-antitoxin system Phd/YefM family antitoxin [Ignavibacteriaceae bacterium]